ncbi:MAG: restriction endonuclease [Flavobacterium sp.]
MSIPKHNELRLPILEILSHGNEYRIKDFYVPLAKRFHLTEEEINEKYPSGNGHVFYDRISWSLSYLNMAGLLDKPKRGVFKINERGIQMLTTPHQIHEYIDEEIAKREPSRSSKKSSDVLTTVDVNDQQSTPQEKLYSSFSNIKNSIKQEILNTILGKTPGEFEKLVVMLLQKMGYGGEIKDSGLVTKPTNDGGIDGIIKEDVLGFGRIHIQAKRFKAENFIGREEIQKFAGALMVAPSNKGVFITTSSFSKGAIDYVNSLNSSSTIVLIDGNKLAEYIYDFGLGMQVEQTIEIKKMDSDFWDTLLDE